MIANIGFFLYVGKIDSNDGVARAFCHTFFTKFAFGVVDMCEVVFKGNGFERTHFNTLAAADARHFAIFHANCAFFVVVAGNDHFHPFRSSFANFNDVARASAGTTAATAANVFVNLWQFGFRIDADSTEMARFDTIAAT